MEKVRISPAEKYSVGQVLSLVFLKPMSGRLPVAFTKEGIVCRISLENMDKKPWVQYESKWKCEIVDVYESKLVVRPLECIKTAEELYFEKLNKKVKPKQKKNENKSNSNQ